MTRELSRDDFRELRNAEIGDNCSLVGSIELNTGGGIEVSIGANEEGGFCWMIGGGTEVINGGAID